MIATAILCMFWSSWLHSHCITSLAASNLRNIWTVNVVYIFDRFNKLEPVDCLTFPFPADAHKHLKGTLSLSLVAFLTCWMEPPAGCDRCTETAGNSSAATDRNQNRRRSTHLTTKTSHNLLIYSLCFVIQIQMLFISSDWIPAFGFSEDSDFITDHHSPD